MSPVLRELAAGDRTCIEELLRSDATFREDEVLVALELVDDALAKLGGAGSDYWFRIAERAGNVAGYICFGPTPMTACTFDLYWIVVHANHRGHGLAPALIREMEAVLRGLGKSAQVRVETSQGEGYDAARRLYEKLGYPEIARFGDFYGPGDDLIVFYKSL